MLAFLVGLRMLGSGEGLEGGYLLVEGREILFDYEGQFIDLDRPVIEEGFSFSHCSKSIWGFV